MRPASLTSLELDPIDFDFHGLARVRLTQASSADARAVARQLGFPGVAAVGPADVVVRYVDHFPGVGSARPVGLEDAAVALARAHQRSDARRRRHRRQPG